MHRMPLHEISCSSCPAVVMTNNMYCLQWFSDAKFGLFIHWGVYSVPAWAVHGRSAPPPRERRFWVPLFEHISRRYAEWYWLSSVHPGEEFAQSRAYHEQNYAGMDYTDMAGTHRVARHKHSSFDIHAFCGRGLQG